MTSIDKIPVPTTDSKINMQPQSGLFGILPGEIRNDIFALALIQGEDDGAAYPEDSYWYRPGFHGPRKSSSALLQTCKLAHAEGQKVYLKELEWAFWFDRGPKDRSSIPACSAFFSKLTPDMVDKLQKVRFFTQMYWLEGGANLRMVLRQKNFRPSTLTITIRYSDWWYWETNAPLRMRTDWLENFMGSVGLKELRVEYETLSWKREEMMKIIQRNKQFKLAVRGEAGHLSAEHTQLVEWKWRGTSKLDGRTWAHHGTADTVEYVVVTDTWVHVAAGDERLKEVAPYEADDSDDPSWEASSRDLDEYFWQHNDY
ncbi:hypothetical protein ACN47E_006673 [Coniothyrium glycines]